MLARALLGIPHILRTFELHVFRANALRVITVGLWRAGFPYQTRASRAQRHVCRLHQQRKRPVVKQLCSGAQRHREGSAVVESLLNLERQLHKRLRQNNDAPSTSDGDIHAARCYKITLWEGAGRVPKVDVVSDDNFTQFKKRSL